ncbi:hypothetical protein [Paenibacillus gallinarum]|uniref:Uncharacterized protein n=1 Tax=Paenibacillus gallinarum TaxID=2762232 RepID=A0ABR8T0C6_9BACL|nr:hypothetical protein [Paenibacillus gallinarum]MBD7969217.1 hypothetical protein [Paenibacillus gallinarum]
MLLHDVLGFNINNTARDVILFLGKEFSRYRITSELWTVLKSLEEKEGIMLRSWLTE